MKHDDITQRLIEARERAQGEAGQDKMIERISQLMAKIDPFDQMMVISAYQASLILELAEGDHETAKLIWQSSWRMSAQMLQDMDQATARPH